MTNTNDLKSEYRVVVKTNNSNITTFFNFSSEEEAVSYKDIIRKMIDSTGPVTYFSVRAEKFVSNPQWVEIL